MIYVVMEKPSHEPSHLVEVLEGPPGLDVEKIIKLVRDNVVWAMRGLRSNAERVRRARELGWPERQRPRAPLLHEWLMLFLERDHGLKRVPFEEVDWA